MDGITDTRLLLIQLQLYTDYSQEEKQDENTGGNRQKNTCRRMEYALKKGGLHRYLSQTT